MTDRDVGARWGTHVHLVWYWGGGTIRIGIRAREGGGGNFGGVGDVRGERRGMLRV